MELERKGLHKPDEGQNAAVKWARNGIHKLDEGQNAAENGAEWSS
ncbi:hypothetical protein [Ureibacillus endophyticus]|nr:hypothetical protein [Lysinibacillus endophyticus]